MDLVYIIFPTLLILVVLAAVWLDRLSVPVILVALGGGILFGSDVLKLLVFDDAVLANHVANIALVFILFQGGFGTKRNDLKSVALPAIGLATWGVVLTAAASFVVLWQVFHWSAAMAGLLAVIISSTDAAATFSILHQHTLPKKLSCTLEIESAANDPMAVLLTVVVVQSLAMGATQNIGMTVLLFAWKFIMGPVFGFVMGRIGLWLFNHLRPQDRGHYYVLFFGLVMLTYGLTEKVQASGMLAVFVAGFILGNHAFVHKQGVANFSSAFSSVANVGMFLLLGLLVSPAQWTKELLIQGVILFAVLTFISRPAAILLGTIGMRIPAKDKVFMSWAGLRGAVPIVLATYPAAANLPYGEKIFNLIFFAVILSILIQGTTLGWFAKRLHLVSKPRAKPMYTLDLITMAQSDMDLVTVDLPDYAGVKGPRIMDLKLPDESVITLITRGEKVISPKGQTRLVGGDQVTILTHVQNEDEVRDALVQPFKEQRNQLRAQAEADAMAAAEEPAPPTAS